MKLRKMPVYSKAADGRKIKTLSRKWYAVFVDFADVLRRLPLMEDKKASGELARTVDRLNSTRAGNDSILPPDLARDVESMPTSIRNTLAKWDIIRAERHAATKPLAQHVQDWKSAILANGGTDRHAELVTSRARKAFNACGFASWTDIAASKLQAHLASLRVDRHKDGKLVARGIGAQTFNFYLQAVKQFCRWMIQDRRATDNPLAHLKGLNVKLDRRHDRRAMGADELRQLLDATAHAVERFGMSGRERKLLYQLAVESGLRAGELRSLTRASFNLEGDDPTVTIAAVSAKNRNDADLPLRPATAAALTIHLAGKMPGALAFNVPARDTVIDMFRADLADARRIWLEARQNAQERSEAEKSSFLSPVDDAGRYVDFHALRHTFISNLVAGNVHPKTAQRLARHSTITLTMDRYTHLRREDLAGALDVLPDLTPAPQAAKATGTDHASATIGTGENFVSPSLSLNSAIRHNSTYLGAINLVTVDDRESEGNTGKTPVFPHEMPKPPSRVELETADLQNRCSAN